MLIVPSFRLRSLVQSVLCHIREARDFADAHPTMLLRQRAIVEAADFVTEQMPGALSFYTAREVLRHCLGLLPETGMILEFGVFKGGTIRYIARAHPGREVHGFDTFSGLPGDWSGMGYAAGAFSAGGRLPSVPGNVRLHRGLFEDSLPVWLSRHNGPVAFIHVDCDLYESTRTVLRGLGPRMAPGTIIVFDEYFGYPGWRRGEHLAWQEFVRDTDLTFEYLCHARQQVAIRVTARAP